MNRREQLAENVTLHLGDCREIIPRLRAADLIATDPPPYGISYRTNYRKATDAPEMMRGDDDAPLWVLPLAESILRECGAIYVCSRFDVAPSWMDAIRKSGFTLKTTIIWDKTIHTAGDLEGDYGNQTELVLFAHRGSHKLRERRDVNLWRIPRPAAGEHPTPKPIDLMARMIRNSSDVGGHVVDPFMGSGTTGVAAVKLGRAFSGVEIDQKYFDICCRRIAEALKQPDMFIQNEPKMRQGAML